MNKAAVNSFVQVFVFIFFFLIKYLEVESLSHGIGVCLPLRKCQTAFQSGCCIGYFLKFITVAGLWSHSRNSAVDLQLAVLYFANQF